MTRQRNVFVTGGTGYIGREVIPGLLARGHAVRALVRPGSERKVPGGCEVVLGNALDATSFEGAVAPSDTLLQLVGTPHPSPAKAHEFRTVDLVSVTASVHAAAAAGVSHFVYVSVAQPSSLMRAYLEVRAEGEALIHDAGLNATILRPWYVLGPGHLWPYALVPLYWVMERIPSTRAAARRLGLVTLPQFVRALVRAVDEPAVGVRIVEVPEIRAGG